LASVSASVTIGIASARGARTADAAGDQRAQLGRAVAQRAAQILDRGRGADLGERHRRGPLDTGVAVAIALPSAGTASSTPCSPSSSATLRTRTTGRDRHVDDAVRDVRHRAQHGHVRLALAQALGRSEQAEQQLGGFPRARRSTLMAASMSEGLSRFWAICASTSRVSVRLSTIA